MMIKKIFLYYFVLCKKGYEVSDDKKLAFIKLKYKNPKVVNQIKEDKHLLNMAFSGHKSILVIRVFMTLVILLFFSLQCVFNDFERLNYLATLFIGIAVAELVQHLPRAIELLNEVDHETIYAKDDEKKDLENKDDIENEIVKVLKSIDKRLSCSSSNQRVGKYIGIGKNKVRK